MRRIAVACIALSLAFPLPALAQGGDAASVAAQAEKDARARKFPAAVDGFKRAYALSPDPAYLYNVGLLSLIGLKDAAQAWEYATQYAEMARNASEKTDAQDLIGKAEAALAETHGRLRLNVTPPTAEVYLDRKAPDTRIRRPVAWVVPGLHNLLAEAPGYESGEVQVTVKTGIKSEVAVVLRGQQARLRIESRTPNAVVLVNGSPAGPAPAEKSVAPGEHVVRAEADGFRPFEQKVRLGPGESLVVHADLAPVGRVTRTASGGGVSAGMSPMKIAGWTSIGTGAALAVTGSVLFALAHKDNDAASSLDRDSYPNQPAYDREYDALIDQRNRKALGAYVTWGLGGAAIATGVVLLLVKPGGGTALVPAGPGDSPGVTAVVRW